MVISHRHKLIFWKPHKVGSTSVLVALGAQCGQQDSVGGVNDAVAGKGGGKVPNYRRNMTAFSHLPTAGNHATPEQMRAVVGVLWGEDLWQCYTKITIVRNPWARAVSWWDYARHQLGRDLDFEQALENTERPYWFDDRGNDQADIYLRCENLDDDYRQLCDRLRIPYEALPTLRKGQRDRSKPYWDYYDDRTRDVVAANFSLEIGRFGYEFGAPA